MSLFVHKNNCLHSTKLNLALILYQQGQGFDFQYFHYNQTNIFQNFNYFCIYFMIIPNANYRIQFYWP
jgi:hypothetical protein